VHSQTGRDRDATLMRALLTRYSDSMAGRRQPRATQRQSHDAAFFLQLKDGDTARVTICSYYRTIPIAHHVSPCSCRCLAWGCRRPAIESLYHVRKCILVDNVVPVGRLGKRRRGEDEGWKAWRRGFWMAPCCSLLPSRSDAQNIAARNDHVNGGRLSSVQTLIITSMNTASRFLRGPR